MSSKRYLFMILMIMMVITSISAVSADENITSDEDIYDDAGDDYIDDDFYDGVEAEHTITVPDAKYGEDKYITFEMPDDADGYFNVNIYSDVETEDVNNFNLKLVNGTAAISLKTFAPNFYMMDVYYTNDTKYAGFDEYYDFTIDPTFKFTVPKSVVAKSYFTLTITGPKEMTGDFSMDVGDEIYDAQFKKGKATVRLKIPTSGTKKIGYTFTSDYGFEYEDSFKVKVLPAPKIDAKPLTMFDGDVAKYKVRIFDSYGKHLKAGQKVTFKVIEDFAGDYRTLYTKTVKTDKNGYASFIIPQKVADKYRGEYAYIQTKYNGVSVKKNLEFKWGLIVYKPTIKKSASKLVIKAKVSKSLAGKSLKNKKITFHFKGKYYFAKTDSKGMAKITVKKSVLKTLKVGKRMRVYVYFHETSDEVYPTVQK